MRVVVVGASGFIGSAIVRAMVGIRGATVTAAVRRPDQRFAALGVETRMCDATDASAVGAALDGATHVVNCVMGPPAAMLAATRNIAGAASRANAQRLVHLSSIAVYGGAGGLLSEDAALGHGVNDYGRAKLGCEDIVREYAERGLRAVILRPSCVHGRNSDLWTGRIGRMLRAHRLGDLGPLGDGVCNLIHVGDVAAAALASLDAPIERYAVCNLSDPDPQTWNAYLMRFARLIGAVPVARISARQLALETKAIAVPLKLAQIASNKLRLRPGATPDPITPSMRRLFAQDVRFDHRNADTVLRLKRTPPDCGLADGAAWFSEVHGARTG